MQKVLLTNAQYYPYKCSALYNSCKCGTEVQTSSMVLHGRNFAPLTPQGKRILVGGQSLVHVERTGCAGSGASHDAEIDHGGRDVCMAEWEVHPSTKPVGSGFSGATKSRLSPMPFGNWE